MRSDGYLSREQIENAVLKVSEYIDFEIQKVRTWHRYSEKELWFELVSCILGSKVRYETANSCVHHLAEAGFLDVSKILTRPEETETKLMREMNKPIFAPFSNGTGCRCRHPKSRSKFIVRTAIRIYKQNDTTIKSILEPCCNAFQARDSLIRICLGIGPKQASLFLRNISYSDDLAILDSHVLRYMNLLGLNESVSQLFSTKTDQYLKKENILSMYAIANKRKLGTLDIAIWTVMRVVQKEFRI